MRAALAWRKRETGRFVTRAHRFDPFKQANADEFARRIVASIG